MSQNHWIKIVLSLFCACAINFSYSQEMEDAQEIEEQESNEQKIVEPIKNPSKVPEALKDKTAIKDPLDLRDPFEIPIKKTSKRKRTVINKGGDIDSKKVDLSTVDIRKIQIVGILVGKEKRAFAKVGDGQEVFVLKEGTKIGFGESAQELKAILPGGVVFIEKIKNVYGDEEYEETIIPITSAPIKIK